MGRFVGTCLRGRLLPGYPYADGPEAFRAPGLFELHTGPLSQSIEIPSPACRAVEENVLPVLRPDEAEATKRDKALSLPLQAYRLLL